MSQNDTFSNQGSVSLMDFKGVSISAIPNRISFYKFCFFPLWGLDKFLDDFSWLLFRLFAEFFLNADDRSDVNEVQWFFFHKYYAKPGGFLSPEELEYYDNVIV